MDSSRNKGLLLAACKANGIAISATDSAESMQARLLGHRVRKRDREIASISVRHDAIVLHNKTTFLHEEVERIGSDIGGVTARNRAQLEAEAESRWQMVKTKNIQENDVFVTDMTSDLSEQFTSNGWVAVIEEPEGTYFRQMKGVKKLSNESEESNESKETNMSNAAVIEEQETAYAIAQVEDHLREEHSREEKRQKPTIAQTADDSVKGAAIESFKAPADDTVATMLTQVRRRCMDWLIINNSPDALAQISGIIEFISENADNLDELAIGVDIKHTDTVNLGNIWKEHTRVLASKISYAIYPAEMDLLPMTVEAKRTAAKPSSLWSTNEIKVMFANQSISRKAPQARALQEAKQADSAEAAQAAQDGYVPPNPGLPARPPNGNDLASVDAEPSETVSPEAVEAPDTCGSKQLPEEDPDKDMALAMSAVADSFE